MSPLLISVGNNREVLPLFFEIKRKFQLLHLICGICDVQFINAWAGALGLVVCFSA